MNSANAAVRPDAKPAVNPVYRRRLLGHRIGMALVDAARW